MDRLLPIGLFENKLTNDIREKPTMWTCDSTIGELRRFEACARPGRASTDQNGDAAEIYRMRSGAHIGHTIVHG